MGLVPVGEVWGIGRKLAKRLNQSGIETALDLSRLPTSQARKLYSVVLERTVRELNGGIVSSAGRNCARQATNYLLSFVWP
ncbi:MULTISPECIES: hypothetical protein [Providencia]|uniref:hypothetical protein n=1 Tax=Providencia TaxID=586 RepID=UPI001CFE10FC|nr:MULTISPECIES: hypothetical protein [Providencia]EIU7559212.1 hypothetical protein [Providencia rettgeri]MCB4843273.1 hypothetical protein [Providencia rettgeri]